MTDFYLHEDDWGMIALEPRENLAARERTVAAAARHAEDHRAPDGVGWTSMFVAPAPEVSLSVRALTLDALGTALGPAWQRHARVLSGYGSYREDCPDAFAFHLASVIHEPGIDDPSAYPPVFYGSLADGVVRTLCITRPEKTIAGELSGLGTAHQLILVDLWTDTVVDLADPIALMRYLTAAEDAAE